MGWLKNAIVGDADKVREHKTAKEALAANTDTTETDAYLDANAEVLRTEKAVPWWRR